MEKKIKVCFVENLVPTILPPFVKKDQIILKKHFQVRVINPKNGWVKFIFVLAKSVLRSDLTFSWFAGWESAFTVFFSKLFRKKSIVVVGGFDAAFIPELDYGAFTNLKDKLPANYIYKNVDIALVVDLSLKKDIIINAKVSGKNIEYLPTGYTTDYWKPKGRKKNIVLTVAAANDMQRVKLKGFDTFVKSAKYLPETKFIVIGIKGKAKTYLKSISSKNVELVEFLQEKELLHYYQRAKVYCQLSLREGLPNTLCEAMLCECIPVGTKRYGIPTAIGDTGFYVPYGDEKVTAEVIKKALAAPDECGKKARERIINNFHIELREKKLVEIISNLVSR